MSDFAQLIVSLTLLASLGLILAGLVSVGATVLAVTGCLGLVGTLLGINPLGLDAWWALAAALGFWSLEMDQRLAPADKRRRIVAVALLFTGVALASDFLLELGAGRAAAIPATATVLCAVAVVPPRDVIGPTLIALTLAPAISCSWFRYCEPVIGGVILHPSDLMAALVFILIAVASWILLPDVRLGE